MGLRLAIARLIATPLFTIFSVVSLAAGVAVTTAVYSVVDTLLLADIGATDPDRTAVLVTPYGGQSERSSVSEPDFEDLRRTQTSLSMISAAAAIQPAIAANGNAETTNAEAVDGAYFATLGIGAERGRVLQPADDAARARVAVLSDEFWRGRFAADPNVVGREIRVDGQVFEVVGVLPARYRGVFGAFRSTRVWIPRSTESLLQPQNPASSPRARQRFFVFGRLAAGRTIAEASAEMGTIGGQLDRAYPSAVSGPVATSSDRQWSAKSLAAFSIEDNGLRRFGMTLVALTGLVLLVACTNLANLVLARGTARQGELAVRMAMGASRARLIWEQCIDSVLLAVTGALASYVMFQAVSAFMTTEFVLALPSGGSATFSIRPTVNPQAVSVAIVALLLALGVFGLEPAVQLARTLDIRSALAAGATGIRPRVRRQRMVIRWQVAIAAGFFIVATMFIRSTINQARHDPGIDMDRIAVAVLNFDNGEWDEARIRRLVDRVMEEGRGDRAIETIAASTGLPFGVPSLQVTVANPDDLEGLTRAPVVAVASTPSLFRTLGIDIVRGRGFNDSDGPGGAASIIVSELAARQWFGSADPVGRRLIVRRRPAADVAAVVVGVARDTDVRRIYTDRRALVYLPLSQHFASGITLTARSTGTATRAVAALREALRKSDPDAAVTAIGTASSLLAGPFVIAGSLGRGALYLGGLSLLLSMVGLFGVQSHLVTHRTREIGVRMSVGASARQIKVMVLKDGYRPVIEGLILGLWGGVAGRLMMRSYMELTDVTIVDPWMLFLTPIPLIAAAFCACYLPASRAARVDPTVALRCE
ncbi:MAG TPA: ABC transporter permease [Vicinamibacterales bacterium]|nr:ABC transporter permease [Vicinamibacterales bacterium]